MSSSAQLEREAEQRRSQLTGTLDELRQRISPGQLVDEAVDYAQDTTGGEFFRNLSRQVAANPLPVALISAGIGWLVLARGNSGRTRGPSGADSGLAGEAVGTRGNAAGPGAGERISEWSAQAGDSANDVTSQAAETAGSWSDRGGDAATRPKSSIADAGAAMSEGAASAYDSMSSKATNAASTAGTAAADAYGRFADTADRTASAMAQSATDAGQKMAGFSGDALAFCKDQPLVLAGLGLALGAVFGALIPPTDAEDRLMGEASDRIKDQARGTAQEQIEKAKTAVQTGMEQAPAQAEHLVNSVGDAATTTLVPQDHDAEAKLPLE